MFYTDRGHKKVVIENLILQRESFIHYKKLYFKKIPFDIEIENYDRTKIHLLEQFKLNYTDLLRFNKIDIDKINFNDVKVLSFLRKDIRIPRNYSREKYDYFQLLIRHISYLRLGRFKINADRKYYVTPPDKLNELERIFIIDEFHLYLRGLLITKAYTFRLPIFGTNISIRAKKNKTMSNRYDWGTSNKIKNELIRNGVTPRLKDNGGEDWLMKHDNEWDYWYVWNSMSTTLKELFLYTFTPSRSAIADLQDYKNNNNHRSLFNFYRGV